MEKKLYELNINEKFQHLIPPLSEGEYALLTEQIVEEGCSDALVVWKGTIVDGHNRYRICHEHGISFAITEIEFEEEYDALLWIIRKQLGRRNVSDFAKCEMVYPLKGSIQEKVRRRKLSGKKIREDAKVSNLTPSHGKTRDILASLAGVSNGTMSMFLKVVENVDDSTIEELRKGEKSIYAAYKELRDKEKGHLADLNPPAPIPEPQEESAEDLPEYRMTLRTDPVDANYPAPPPIAPPQDDLNDPDEMERKYLRPEDVIKDDNTRYFPGRSLVSKPAPAPQDVNFCPPDSVYDLPPVETYGGVPANDLFLRSSAEFAHVYGETKRTLGYFTNRMAQIIRLITVASSTEQNLNTLLTMLDESFDKIRNDIMEAMNYEYNEE